ncbi:HNH endonuclease [Rothia aeria]|nr:HNH endonuclease [Rothia aeria]
MPGSEVFSEFFGMGCRRYRTGLTWHHHNSPGKLELVDR